jgi:hypothetical protein
MPQSARTPLTPRDRARLTVRASLEVEKSPVGFRFSEVRHGLTAAQCVQANQRLRHLECTRPILERGDRGQAKRALRIAGILSSVKGNRVGNRRWGKRMMGKRAGKVMAIHALAHLRSYAPIAHLASRLARERREAETYYEEHGVPLAIGATSKETPEQARVRSLQDAWEAQCQTQQLEHLRW